MKKKYLILVCVCSMLSFVVPRVLYAEYIEDFSSHITIRNDASFEVVETITYVFDEEPRHGIVRTIPRMHPEPASSILKERIIAIDLTEVALDDVPVPYVIESDSDSFVVRVGDPEETLEGSHTYTLRYTVTGGLSYPKIGGAELYWNVSGNGWSVPVRTVQGTMYDPDKIVGAARSCYAGELGDTSTSCTVIEGSDGSITFRATNLLPYEGMTIAQSLNVTKTAKVVHERFKIAWLAVPLMLLLCTYGGWRLYRYKTEHTTGRVIIPEYEPYPHMKPMYTGFMMDGRLDPRDITACIVYLGEQGYLSIKKIERKVLFLFEVDDYEITLRKLPDSALSQFEHKVFGLIFKDPLSVGAVVALGDLKKDMSERKENYEEFTALERALREDLRAKGFREVMGWGSMAHTIGVVVIIWSIFYTLLAGEIHGGLFVSAAFIAVVLGIFLYERKTRLAYEVTDYLKGFRLFLETTERDRYLFHNAPEKSPEQFMEFLPYAIAFGVEEKWAEVFKDIVLPAPDWYGGGNAGTFNAASLAHSFGAFSTAFAQSSGASASSGGGSSGGGAGGGGGGSW